LPHNLIAKKVGEFSFYRKKADILITVLGESATPFIADKLRRFTMKKLATAIFLVLLATVSSFAYAHSGGTDANGCHYDHRTGTYHCH
jgi:hypothetical protein